jgi:CTP synthase
MRFIFITGGVLSGVGKGIASASIGNLLAASGLRVVPIKCEGYLNVDPGTMNPLEHGEVFVLDDGEEADMDFGHYERFIGVSCKRHWNITMGKVFETIRERERRGDYLGKTVQYVPHVTEHIKERWKSIVEEESADIAIIEIGGTVGDIETALHIEAARQMKRDLGRENTMYIHLAYVPKPPSLGEFKTKPTQQSLILLLERGITPQAIITRSQEPIGERPREKIGIFSGLETDSIIENYNIDNVYKIPLSFNDQGIARVIGAHFGIPIEPDVSEWRARIEAMDHPEHEISVAICGKYTQVEDSYASVREAIVHAAAALGARASITCIETTDIETLEDAGKRVEGFDAVIVPGGFGSRGIEGKIRIIEVCRTKGIPYLGICYGLQLAVIEAARNLLGYADAHTTEVDEHTAHPIVDILPEQVNVTNKGGTMRLGAYPAVLTKGSRIADLYGSLEISERHRHRFEVNPEYHDALESVGVRLCGLDPTGRLVEFIERDDHPYFVGSQGHIELKSTLLKPAPLFVGLVRAAIGRTA